MDRLQCSEFSSIEMEVDLIQKMTLDQEEKRIQVEAKARSKQRFAVSLPPLTVIDSTT